MAMAVKAFTRYLYYTLCLFFAAPSGVSYCSIKINERKSEPIQASGKPRRGASGAIANGARDGEPTWK